jgi:hypothetical protein
MDRFDDRRAAGMAPDCPLDLLDLRVTALWNSEPDVAEPALRGELLAALCALDHDVERLALRRSAGAHLDAEEALVLDDRLAVLERGWTGRAGPRAA